MHVQQHIVNHQRCSSLQEIPNHLSMYWFKVLVSRLDAMNVCCGNPDANYTEMLESKKGKIVSATGATIAYLDTNCQKTVRHHSCILLTEEKYSKCSGCSSYRDNLRSIYYNYIKSKQSEPSVRSNFRYLSSPQKKAFEISEASFSE